MLATDLFGLPSLLTVRSNRAGTGKSKLTPVTTPAEDTSKDELCSDGEPVEDSDYDTDLEFEEPREEYDPTGKINHCCVSLECRCILTSERAHFYQASGIKLGRGLRRDERRPRE